MPKPKRNWPVIVGILFIVGFIAAMVGSTTGNSTYRCEVCIDFGGRQVCRNGAASTETEAERIAATSACTDLSSGMTSLMQCEQSAPRHVSWKRKGGEEPAPAAR
jgi:hypothetical protein